MGGEGGIGPSFHSLLESRQHALRPDRRCDPGPSAPNLSSLRSLVGHCGWGEFRRPGHHASTFLHPFARRALPRVSATMGALTPVRLSSSHRSPCFTCTALATIPSPTTPCPRRRRFPTLPLSSTGLPPSHRVGGSRLRPSLAGSPGHRAESSSSSYGLVVHLLLLPTSPHGDAVTVGYRLESVLPGEDSHLSVRACLQAHGCGDLAPL